MARPARLSFPSYPHHVIQRGNNRQPILLAPKDYEREEGCQFPSSDGRACCVFRLTSWQFRHEPS